MTPIERRVASILRDALDTSARQRELSADTPMRELGIGSLNLVRLLVALESAFDIEFEDEHVDLARFTTIAELSRYIEQQIQLGDRAERVCASPDGDEPGERP